MRFDQSYVEKLEARVKELEGVQEAYQRILERVGEFDRENKRLLEALIKAERIIDMLTTGFWQSVIQMHDDGDEVYTMIKEYWQAK